MMYVLGCTADMDPIDLPVEVHERIFILLPVKDILSCCLVSAQWREAVNKNMIWKRFCSRAILSEIENKENMVEPAFVPPPESSTLSSVCKSRLNYMREVHLKNNFRNNRCVEHKLSRVNYYQDKTEFVGKFMLLNDSSKNTFHIWDIDDEPVLCQSVQYLLQEMCLETFEAIGNRLLIVQCNLLQVYEVVDDKFTLEMCRLFDKDEECSKDIPSDNTIGSWYSLNVGLHPCDFTSINKTVGKYFVGIVEPSQLQYSVIHIWDLESGKKLKEENIPETSGSITAICCGKNSECLYIALYINNSNCRCKIFSYSLKTLQYTQFYVESHHALPFMLFEEKVVILPCDQWENSGSYLFLDPNTGKQISETKFEKPMNPKAIDVYGSILAFGSGNSVTVVDLLTHKVLTNLSLAFQVMEVYLIDNNILLVGGVDYHYALQVWDIHKSKRLISFHEKSILFCGRTMQRLCLQSMYSVHVLHFW